MLRVDKLYRAADSKRITKFLLVMTIYKVKQVIFTCLTGKTKQKINISWHLYFLSLQMCSLGGSDFMPVGVGTDKASLT